MRLLCLLAGLIAFAAGLVVLGLIVASLVWLVVLAGVWGVVVTFATGAALQAHS